MNPITGGVYLEHRHGHCCDCGHRYFAEAPTTAPCTHCQRARDHAARRAAEPQVTCCRCGDRWPVRTTAERVDGPVCQPCLYPAEVA